MMMPKNMMMKKWTMKNIKIVKKWKIKNIKKLLNYRMTNNKRMTMKVDLENNIKDIRDKIRMKIRNLNLIMILS